MTNKEEFEKWATERHYPLGMTHGLYSDAMTQTAFLVYEELQPEIDEFKGLASEAADEMDATTRDLIKLGAERDALKADNEGLSLAVSLLQAEVERLRKDAERYQAIPSLDWYVGPRFHTYNDEVVEGRYCDHGLSKQILDAAIDAAMKETK